MGRSLARRLAERGDGVFLLGRDARALSAACRDLELRANRPAGAIRAAPCDLLKPAGFTKALDAAAKALGSFDTVIVTAGLFAPQETLEQDAALCARMLTVNFTHTVLFCEEARKRLLAQGGGTLCVFSSVAGERGRKPVLLYGAAKAGLTRYLEGLDHKFHGAGLKVVTVKPGFVRTDMTQGLTPPPFAGLPDAVAGSVLKAIVAGRPVVYAPAAWALVMLVIRNLPRFVMRKIRF